MVVVKTEMRIFYNNKIKVNEDLAKFVKKNVTDSLPNFRYLYETQSAYHGVGGRTLGSLAVPS